jgi:EAL domain-containing protein (putative c-di-GMP-specific phosphodiesterase class I)
MQDAELTRSMLRKLHKMGVHLSIDDFGTGYSSLGYLKQFPLDTLKIDKSFVRDLASDPQNAGIINAIMTLGRGFNLRVIAEGVETEAEKNCLLSLQCKEMQGYLSSPPLPAEEATQLLRDSRFRSSKISIVA